MAKSRGWIKTRKPSKDRCRHSHTVKATCSFCAHEKAGIKDVPGIS